MILCTRPGCQTTAGCKCGSPFTLKPQAPVVTGGGTPETRLMYASFALGQAQRILEEAERNFREALKDYQGDSPAARPQRRLSPENYINHVLEATGMSPTGLAKKAGLSATTLTRALNSPAHKFTLSTTTLDKIEKATGIPR